MPPIKSGTRLVDDLSAFAGRRLNKKEIDAATALRRSSLGRLLTVREAAVELELREQTLRKWVLLRKVGVVRLSARCVRIPQSEIDRHIEAAYVPPREVAV